MGKKVSSSKQKETSLPWKKGFQNRAKPIPCLHGKLKRNCVDRNSCSHGRVKGKCADCNPCPQGKLKRNCVDCTCCPHGKLKENCAVCNACPHGKVKRTCQACKAARVRRLTSLGIMREPENKQTKQFTIRGHFGFDA
jgi:hypothetical protein